jgi:hypothetical protein
MQQRFHPTPINLMHNTRLYSSAFYKRRKAYNAPRLAWDLTQSQLACTVLGNISTLGMHSMGPSIFRMGPPTPSWVPLQHHMCWHLLTLLLRFVFPSNAAKKYLDDSS